MSKAAWEWAGGCKPNLRRIVLGWVLFATLLASALPAMANGDFSLQMFDNPSPVDRGSDLTFQANVSRSSGDADHNIPVGQTLSFALPANLSFVSISSSSSFSCVSPAVGSSGMTVTCQVVSAIYGTFETVTLVTNTTSDAANSRTMTATLANPDDTAPADNFATTTTPVTTPRTPTTTVTTSSQQQSVFGESVTFTATVTGAGATPTGLLAFFIDGNPGNPIALDANGQATFTTSTLAIGNHPVCANYLGDSENLPSCGVLAGGQEVNAASTTLALTSSLNPSNVGDSVTFTATVSAVSGTPTGTVTFSIDGIGQAPVALSGGSATLTTASLTAGGHSILATYSGDGGFAASVPAILTQTVGQAGLTTTYTTLRSYRNPSNVGQSVEFVASINSFLLTARTGTVTFTIDGTVQPPVTVSSNDAVFITSALTAGNHTIGATYSGDGTFASSSADPIIQAVGLAPTTAALVSSANPSRVGQPVTFTTTVLADSGTPTGSVTFTIDGVAEAPVVLSNGAASLTTATLSSGTHYVDASYSGDSVFAAKVASPIVQGVLANPTTTVVASSPNPSNLGEAVTLTATVTSPLGVPTGTVQFQILGAVQPEVPVVNGVATMVTTTLPGGDIPIGAEYRGDATFAMSDATRILQTVVLPATATTLVSSLNPSNAGQDVTFTATTSSASGTPSGVMIFFDGAERIANVPINSSGVAFFTYGRLSAGTHSMTAHFFGTEDFAPSTSAAIAQVVNANATVTTLTSSLNPSHQGQTVAFTANVSAGSGTPVGTVTFDIDGTAQAPVSLSGGAASLSIASLGVGSHVVTARYDGDPAFLASSSPPLAQEVQAAAGTVVIRQVTDGPDQAYGFTSPTAGLSLSITTVSGRGESAAIIVPAGTHVVTADDTRGQGLALTALACSDDDSTADIANRTATIVVASGESVICTFTSTDTRTHTTDLIDDFLATRADLILSNQPDTDRRVDRLNGVPATSGDPMGAFMGYLPGLAASSPLSVSTSLNALNRMTGLGDPESPFDIWFKGTYASLDSDTGGGTFALATFGADYVLSRDLLVGAIVQIDRLSLDRQGSSISGTGWLAGPYLTARLAPSVFLDVVAAAGTSSNTISPYASYSDDFDTTRWMLQAVLKGEWTRDAWTFSPGARLGYFSDGSQAYVDSVGVAIPDVSVALGQFAISPEISYRFETEGDVTVDTRLKLEGISDFTEDGDKTGFGDLHGRVEAGIDFTMKGGMRLGLATAYDGIGSSDLTAIGGSLKLSVPLN